nr:2-hydroxychromene-2-carboxylate isomerase [Caldimonas sp.]
MSATVEFFFDVGSPASYLAWTQLPRIAAETSATIAWRPMLLGGVFKATGNASPVNVPAKGRWMTQDLHRWARRYGVPFSLNPSFPINTLTLMRGAAGMQMRHADSFLAYVDAIYRAMFESPRNLGDADALVATLREAGFDPGEFAALVADPEVKARLIATTEEAVARGVFGAPTFFVGEQMHFGQDRLEFVREARLAERAS